MSSLSIQAEKAAQRSKDGQAARVLTGFDWRLVNGRIDENSCCIGRMQ